ncbi:MAG: folate-binding protein YgfZ [Gammaproteobacteria bacterium]|nr:MAG: folate-binding protein YgfZ [Gammaproteobacteria bacterium]
MISEWKEFLANAGAEFSDTGVAHYGSLRRELSVATTGNIFADLSHYGLISAHGEDTETFLQGQFTNDIRKVTDGHSQLSGLCNPKGRLLATFRVFHRGDSYYLCLPASMLEDVIKRLRMFVLRSKVTLEDASDTFVHLGVSGDDAQQELRKFAGELPDTVNAAVQAGHHTIIQVPGVHPSYEIFTTVDDARQLWDRLNVQSAPIGADAWQLLDIQAGIPVISPQTREAFVPQMTNLQLIDGVSFQKGCYTGQEIVARMQYLGKLKRRMYRARIDNGPRPTGDEEVFSADNAQQSAGKLVSAAPHPDGGYAMLVVLQIASAESESGLHLGSVDGPLLELETLPYPFAED